MIKIALFDLDETLVRCDTSAEWTSFVIEKKLVRSSSYLTQSKQFCLDYRRGSLNLEQQMQHSLLPLKGLSIKQASVIVNEFAKTKILPKIYPDSWQTLQHHRSLGHYLILISASGTHLLNTIGQLFNIDVCIGTQAEIIDGCYTGFMHGIPSFQHGKITRFNAWLHDNNLQAKETWFYSDSENDLPLLEYVDHPVITNPTPSLEKFATQKNWPIIRWKLKPNSKEQVDQKELEQSLEH